MPATITLSLPVGVNSFTAPDGTHYAPATPGRVLVDPKHIGAAIIAGLRYPNPAPYEINCDLPVLCVGWDHPYLQAYGTNGRDGMAAMYLDRGIRPYMAINTADFGGDFPGAPGRMSYAQMRELEDMGVEVVNHGCRHFQSWIRGATGITLRYTGAGTDAFYTINTSKLFTTTCTAAAGDNLSFDLTNASYNTLQKLVDAINAAASGVYRASLAPELTGNEMSINLASITGAGIRGAVADTGYSQTSWAASTAYSVGVVRKGLASDNGYYFVCTTAGTSAASEPTWVKQIGATTTDGSVTWTCRYAQAVMLTNAVASVPFKGWNVSASPGIIVQHLQTAGTARISAMVNVTSSALVLYEDGVAVASFTLNNASYDTLTELVAAINAFKEPSDGTTSNWQAKLCDNTYYDAGTFGAGQAGPAFNNFNSGGELSVDLKSCPFVDCSTGWVRIDGGLNGWYVNERNIQAADDTMRANGLNPKAFAQSGGECYPWVQAGHAQYGSWRGDPFSRASINPMAVPLAAAKDFGGWFPHKDINDVTPISADTLLSYTQALVESGPWLMYMLCHWCVVDGTSGYNLNPQPPGTGFGTTEGALNTAIINWQRLIGQGRLQNCTPSELPRACAGASPPRSYVFNPKLRNSGESLASLASEGRKLGGWLVRSSTIPTISIDKDGLLTMLASGSSQIPISQDLVLEPGRAYEVILPVMLDSAAVGNGVRLGIQSRRGGSNTGPRFHSMDPAASNVIASPYLNKSGMLRFRFVWPKRQDYARAFVRGLMTEPFDLSTNKNIQVNYDSIGLTADIDCSLGAALASAVTAKEIANRINTVVAATAAYLTRPEFHTAARAENGRVIIESPFRGNTNSTYWVRAGQGSSLSALTAIFGAGSGLTCQGEPMVGGYQALEDSSVFLYVEVNTTNGAQVQFYAPWVSPSVYL